MSKTQLFKKVAVFTDLHVGLKNNSRTHNQDCERFIIWFIEQAKARGAETCIFMGDFHHHRATINVSSLNYTMTALRMLSAGFEKVYMITGNHDLYYREKREIHSLIMGEEFPNIHVVSETYTEGDVAIVPWLVEDEYKKTIKIKSKYMFGHFEIPGFKLNAMIEMPDHGGLNKTMFKNQDYVFSGHFHKRQWSGNVHYIGNPFGHNYADSWDFERGAMFLEWGSKPEYVNWNDGPKYITVDLSDLTADPDTYLVDHGHLKVTIDVKISYEEINYIKELFSTEYNVREIKLMPVKNDTFSEVLESDIVFETVDQIVTDEILMIKSAQYNNQILISIYNHLD
jgi:DNA repair exonuclease SbcCD nuclease subunit